MEQAKASYKIKNALITFLLLVGLCILAYILWSPFVLLLILSVMGLDPVATNLILFLPNVFIFFVLLALTFAGRNIFHKRGFKALFIELILPTLIIVFVLSILTISYNINLAKMRKEHIFQSENTVIIPEKICYSINTRRQNFIRFIGQIKSPKGKFSFESCLGSSINGKVSGMCTSGNNSVDDVQAIGYNEYNYDGQPHKLLIDFPVWNVNEAIGKNGIKIDSGETNLFNVQIPENFLQNVNNFFLTHNQTGIYCANVDSIKN
ncbi:MAG: hypothetical protein NTW06_01360 [Candidatus Falkowbacteria bacterium]|nr:hypothetical protein [Candidatus Falkowbacteria bacterium]